MFIDQTYIIYVLPCIILALWAQHYVKSTFHKYAQQGTIRGMTGAEAAERVLKSNGIYDVRVEPCSGKLTDHFDPKAHVIRLSEDVYASSSTAAIGVACHEAGHAVQYAEHYAPIYIRAAIIPVTNFGTMVSMPLIILGILLEGLSQVFFGFVYLGIIFFSFSVVFQLLTLPVEFDASNRALKAIKAGEFLTEDEYIGARKTLIAAAMTYLAAAATAIAQLLRLIAIFGRRDHD